MAKIILSNDKFRGAMKVYADQGHGAAVLIGTYRENCDGWGAETGDGQTFHAATKAALRSKIAAHINA